MQTKRRRALETATLVFAFTMLTGYVVYSQRQSTRAARDFQAAGLAQAAAPAASTATNLSRTVPPIKVAPGSKAMAPLVELRPRGLTLRTNPSLRAIELMTVAFSSKSGQVFQPQFLQYELFQPRPLLQYEVSPPRLLHYLESNSVIKREFP